jgi:DnaJ-class molecular chaperone
MMQELLEEYKILDVPVGDSFSHVKEAYRDLIQVWHPDRFSGHPRLQKKAEEKLKSINGAFARICDRYQSPPPPSPSPPTSPPSNPTGPKGHQQSTQRARTWTNNPQQTTTRQTHHASSHSGFQHPPRSQAKTAQCGYNAKISFQQATGVLSTFPAQFISRTGQCQRYRIGPFRVELNEHEPWVLVANLCEVMNGFHPLLLTIPCKATGIFYGSEAQCLIDLLQCGTEPFGREF